MIRKSLSMNTQADKVYVAVGDDLQDGYKTLGWTLRRWKSQPISIVILHVTYKTAQDVVHTQYGKLPAKSISEEKLEVLRKFEQGKTDNLLSNYVAFCAKFKVKADIYRVEKNDEQIHKLIVDLISELRITKLVLGITFMKSSLGKSKNAISGSFYVHQQKPEFCELFIICGGKLVFLKGNKDEGFMEDELGVMVAKIKDKPIFKSFARIFIENTSSRKYSQNSSMTSEHQDSQNEWENCVQDVENYFQHLLSLNLDEENLEEKEEILETSPIDPADAPGYADFDPADAPEYADSTMTATEKREFLGSKIEEAQQTIQLKKKEAKYFAERQAKAEWAIRLCNARAEKLEAQVKEEFTKRLELQKGLDSEKDQVYEVSRDVEESKNRLESLKELQSELTNKVRKSTLSRARAVAQLEKDAIARAELVREIEEIRRQRDVLQRRIEFCREKDAIGMVTRSNELNCGFREYTAEDIRLATDYFSERLRLKSGGDWTRVYRGRINHSTVAIKMLNSVDGLSQEEFLAKVKLLNDIHHPHLVAIMGFCYELRCIILEYMHNGSLRDILFLSQKSYRGRNKVLQWHDRIRIAHEVCSGLTFLHLAEPTPIFHGHLTASNILLDRNLVAKITGFVLPEQNNQYCNLRSDVRAFGALLLQLLTGRNWAGLVEDAMAIDRAALVRVLDEVAGKWPSDLAEEVARIAMRCFLDDPNTELRIAAVMEELDGLKKRADNAVASGPEVAANEGVNREDSGVVPNVFVCPILQEIMKDPYVAADGYSYELEAIEQWMKLGHDTSPLTNLRLNHKGLTPNHTLRFLIQEWQNNR